MLFDAIVYGPIHSRRLGVSLGVNLMPVDGKLCSFDCVYCECGFNHPFPHLHLPSREEVSQALESKLASMDVSPDVITFSGNGEPTMHPDFESIINDTCLLRDRYCPRAKVSVLSNSTQLFRPDVVRALRRADNRILKLDSAIDSTMRIIEQPVHQDLTVAQIMDWLRAFDGDFTLQTCFLRGRHNGVIVDNTTEQELSAWYGAVRMLHPKQVMIYVIDRKTPVETLYKVPREEMERIADVLRAQGIEVSVSA